MPVPAPVVAVVPARAPPTSFQSAEAKVFWPLAEEAVVLSVAAEAVPCAAQAKGSAPPAVWESERCRVLAPVAPMLAEVPKWAVAKEY